MTPPSFQVGDIIMRKPKFGARMIYRVTDIFTYANISCYYQVQFLNEEKQLKHIIATDTIDRQFELDVNDTFLKYGERECTILNCL